MHPSSQPSLLLEFREAEDPASKPWFPPLEHQLSMVWDVAWALGFFKALQVNPLLTPVF